MIGVVQQIGADDSLDTREGVDLVLKCRFTEHYDSTDFTFYWARWTCCPTLFENVAIGDVQLNSNYRLDFRPGRGIYDLQIKNTSYNRDNGRFECRIKAKGTGADVHQEFYNLTVLTAPHPPMVTPGNIAVATEEKPLELTCSSIGGSPDPMITWYREGSTVPLQSYALKGGSKNHYTNATLQIVPRRADDGAKYKCVVWNRAMPEGHTLETSVSLNVNYYPRVEVGPQNPMRIERDHVAKLECRVDAKPMVSNVRWSRNGQYVSATPVHTIYRVNRHHAGKYTCSADNGLGKTGEKDIVLDVLYPPIVVIESKTHEAEEGETVLVRCNVTANPPPITIEWLKEGAPDFRYTGELLTLVSVRAEHAGNYICRSVNIMQPFNTKRIEGVGNSTVALLVRHRPGQAYITPNKPVVHVGNGVTLTCSANPPGWPVPQYRWFRDMDGDVGNTQKILAQGPQYSIPKAHLGSEGKYHCHAVNELGIGKIATIILEVHQPPQFLAKLQQHMTRRVGDVDYAVTCSAKGKPTPQIRWIKDGTEILPTRKMFDIRTTPTDAGGGVVAVQSILRFRGKARPNGNQLLPSDRGLYTCLYENDVNSANSSMHLRIEHEPIIIHQYNKVAFDMRESAEVVCRVQAYPKPEFQWQFGNNPSPLTMSSDGHYEISTRMENNDIYTSILRIAHLQHSDYGEYICRAVNPLDSIRAPIKLQPKGQPEKPTNLKVLEVAHNYAVLAWLPGFNGGFMSTKYLVSYRRVATPREQLLADCSGHGYIPSYQVSSSSSNVGAHEWIEFNCFRENPCKLAPLDQHQSYMFKVYALNSKGTSGYSNEVLATTKVSKIPPPLHVSYDPNSHVLGINVAATCLSLIAVVESLVTREATVPMWEIVETLTLLPSGSETTFKEAVINHMARTAHYTTATSSGRNGAHLGEDRTMALAETAGPGPVVRVKLCLRSNHEHCGAYANAEIGKSYMPHNSSMTTSALVAIVIASLSFLVFLALLYAFCRCRRTHAAKKQAAGGNATTTTTTTTTGTGPGAKEYDLDDTPTSGADPQQTQQQQQQQQHPPNLPPPPPYYPSGTLDSKQDGGSGSGSGGMELTLTALHDPDEQLNMQQQQNEALHSGLYHQPQAAASAKAILGLYGGGGGGGSQHSNGYGYHVTSAIGVDGDSYQVMPSAAAAAAGGHGAGESGPLEATPVAGNNNNNQKQQQQQKLQQNSARANLTNQPTITNITNTICNSSTNLTNPTPHTHTQPNTHTHTHSKLLTTHNSNATSTLKRKNHLGSGKDRIERERAAMLTAATAATTTALATTITTTSRNAKTATTTTTLAITGSSNNSNENNYSNARDLSQEALWRLQLAAAQSQQIYVERPPSAFSGLVDYSGYPPHIQTVTSSLSQQNFGQSTGGGGAGASGTQPLAPHEMLQAAQRYGTLRKSGKQPPLPPMRKDLQQQQQQQQKPQQQQLADIIQDLAN
ncbi:blast:Hemicentin-1 [Drosophila guanche]|uniref:Blast:Hemicentin-1 n=3 Tax=Drosophila guanche TaxID=7266 RepID=A0A3B0K673_DROGU|nr:blast:Hemicentin-1 [Drosophila guanche]